MSGHRFHPNILREYDVRGTVGKTLSAADAHALGRSYGAVVSRSGGKTICVGYDGRVTSPELEGALVEGLVASGLQVTRVGRGPTPLLYFAVFHLQTDAGVMVTGSHNPPDQNGFKIMLGRKAYHGKAIAELGRIAAAGDYVNGKGSAVARDVRDAYVETLRKGMQGGAAGRPLKIVWDPGNGAAGELVARLSKHLPGEHILINEKIDGTFPAHHPDPSQEKNLAQLKQLMRDHHADLGLAFDGDGDRLGVVDDRGNTILPDQLLAIFAADVLRDRPGAPIIADVKSSQMLFDEVARLGGKPVMWKTGHALIKDKLAEIKAPLAGELSGHIFFADRYFGFDDALYSAVRLINLLSGSATSLADLVERLPKWVNTAELRVHCAEERKFAVITELQERLRGSGATVIDIDGVRVVSPDGWWLVRASNTEASLVIRSEARSQDGLRRVQATLEKELERSGVRLEASAGHGH